MKILHLEANRYPQESLDKLSQVAELTCLEVSGQEELIAHLEQYSYDAIFTRLGIYLDQSCLDSQSQLRYIVTATTGLNHIDVEYCKTRGIELLSLKGEDKFLARIKSTAEHTWLLLLSIIRNFPASYLSVKEGNWQREPFLAEELSEKTLGIIGFGRLGKIIAQYANAFGMEVLANDIDPNKIPEDGFVKEVGLDALLSSSDIVILMVSYSPENVDLLAKREFALLKKAAYFVNTSRGEMVDEDALIEALENGTIKAAALDVMKDDSSWSSQVPSDNKLLTYSQQNTNLILTPHMGGYGKQSIERTREFVTDKLLAQLNL